MQRQLALEVIVTLSETAAAMLRRHTNIVAQASKYFVHFLCWNNLFSFTLLNWLCRCSSSKNVSNLFFFFFFFAVVGNLKWQNWISYGENAFLLWLFINESLLMQPPEICIKLQWTLIRSFQGKYSFHAVLLALGICNVKKKKCWWIQFWSPTFGVWYVGQILCGAGNCRLKEFSMHVELQCWLKAVNLKIRCSCKRLD